ncbi:alpha/beta fold hydrolase [Pseudoalteromonas sp. NZS127]|uniref:alpha/beta hydrolase n=1 Tax=Pseudoalteromonas TaxID=53246 RepID=UPI0018CCC1EF|nr:alpha/beta fold hydrolase [Pseudoalteromonas sp. NZS127]MBH0073119.1 alpha/beta fold hydrolase [Pseudoalteromonas sp. NZS127]
MNNNSVFLKIFLTCMLSFLPHLAVAENCITQANDFEFIKKSKQQGLLRYTKEHYQAYFDYQARAPFNSYLNHAYQYISVANPRAAMPCPVFTQTYQQLVIQGTRKPNPTIADIIAPFELIHPQSKKAVLLVHGLTDSPFTYHDLAQVYYQQGYTVRTILLPGHGSAASALQDVDLQQWQQAVRYAIERTAQDFDEVILGGYSTGAALLIDYAITQALSSKITALMLFSPGSEPHNKQGWMAKWLDLIPFLNWIDKDADVDFAKYESFPLNAAAASHDAMSLVSIKNLSKRPALALPIFSVISDIDATIDSHATLKLLNALHNTNLSRYKKLDTLVLYGSSTILPPNFAADYRVLNPQCASEACLKIHGISHIAIVNSPQNPHYGINASYRNCGSFIGGEKLYKTCKTTKTPQFGERTAANLKQYPTLQRLTYNPFFPELKKQISTFIKNVEHAQGK